MAVIEYLKNLLAGRGFFASFLVISGWSYAIVLVVVLIYQCFYALFAGNKQ